MKIIKVCISILVLSWIYSILDYYVPILDNTHNDIYYIYATRGIPFTLIIMIVTDFINKKQTKK